MKLWFHCYEDESGGDNGGNKDGLIAFLLRQEGEISESRVGKGLAKATWAKKKCGAKWAENELYEKIVEK